MEDNRTTPMPDPSKTVRAYRRLFLRKLAAVIVIAAASVSTMVAFLSTAWFAANNRTDASGTVISARGPGYELAVKGEAGKWDDKLTDVADGTKVTVDADTYYTTASDAAIAWKLEDGSHLNNQQDTGTGLNPGAAGQLTFYIHSKTSGELSVTFRLRMEGWDSDMKAAKEPLQRLLRGHILLFAGHEDGLYQNWISPFAGTWTRTLDNGATLTGNGDGSLTWTGTVEEGAFYPVTIYWLWPEVLGQYLFSSGERIGGRPVLFPNEVPDGLFDAMCMGTGETSNDFFLWDSTSPAVTPDTLSGLRANYNTLLYGKVCTYYNAADQKIGDNIRYMTLRLDAE